MYPWGDYKFLIKYEFIHAQHTFCVFPFRWGISRHFHYLPEILAAFFWTVPALFSHVRINCNLREKFSVFFIQEHANTIFFLAIILFCSFYRTFMLSSLPSFFLTEPKEMMIDVGQSKQISHNSSFYLKLLIPIS